MLEISDNYNFSKSDRNYKKNIESNVADILYFENFCLISRNLSREKNNKKSQEIII